MFQSVSFVSPTRLLNPTTSLLSLHSSTTTTALHNVATAASSYFTSIRIPAALIVGSSLAASFTFVNRRVHSKWEARVLRLYHVLVLTALVLSLNVVIMSTATANTLLLQSSTAASSSTVAFSSVFEFLQANLEYEFLLVRWSFFMGLFSFLGCVCTRILLEFDLLKRKTTALLVLSSTGALLSHWISFVNERVTNRNNLGVMTMDLLRLYLARCRLSVMGVSSAACVMVALLAGTKLAREHFREVDEVFEDTDGESILSDSKNSNSGMGMATNGGGYRHSVMSSVSTTESASSDSSTSDGGGSINVNQTTPTSDVSVDDL